MKKSSEYYKVLIISILSYFAFYFPLLVPTLFLGGMDMYTYFYPSRYYLHEQLTQGKFPFYTEKIFSGYPIFGDPERAYLNPINILSVLINGPFVSVKVLHFGFYLLGSLCFYTLLKRKSVNMLGFFVANAIYYFSFFMLYRMQHLSFYLTLFLLPLGFLLVDNLKEKFSYKNLAVLSVLYSVLVLFGSYQSVLLYIVPQILYFFILSEKLPKKLLLVKGAVFAFLIIISLTLPQLVSSFDLYKQSVRYLESGPSQEYLQGSFMPFMLINLVYPYSMGLGDKYIWNQINGDFFIHEVYTYVGLVPIFLALLGFFLVDKKSKTFFVTVFALYILFSFWKYLPLFSSLEIPVFSSFRYWGRAVVWLVFMVAYLCGIFFSKKTTKIPVKPLVAFVVGLAVWVLVTHAVRGDLSRLMSLIYFRGVKDNPFFIPFIILTILYIIPLFLYLKNKIELSKKIISVLIFMHLWIFGFPIILYYLRDISYLYPKEEIAKSALYEKQRTYFGHTVENHNLGLYTKSYGVLGYSQFVPKKYREYLTQIGIKNEKKFEPWSNPQFPALLGLGNYPFIFEGVLNEKNFGEGDIYLKINSSQKQPLYSKIRNYPEWEILVNGKKVAQEKNDPYLIFPIPQGNVVIQMKYVPRSFYLSLGISSAIIFVVLPALYFLHKRKYEQ